MEKMTAQQKEYATILGIQFCVDAYEMHLDGSGGNTVGEEFADKANEVFELKGFDKRITPSSFTKFGDCIIDAGRALVRGDEKHHLQNIEENNLQISEATDQHPKIYWMYRAHRSVVGAGYQFIIYGYDRNNNQWTGEQMQYGEDYQEITNIDMV